MEFPYNRDDISLAHDEERSQYVDEGNKKENNKRNLKSWAVKLPEDVIDEIEALYEASDARFKNEFIEQLIKHHKVNQLKEGKHSEQLIHPEVYKNMSGDVYQLAKLTHSINEMFVHQLEKFSIEQHEFDRLKRKNKALEHQNNHLNTVIDDFTNGGTQNTATQFDEQLIDNLNKKNTHTLLLGSSGCGKTYTTIKEIKRSLEQNKKVFLIDYTGEYKKIVEHFNGTYIKLSSKSSDMINPFDMLHFKQEKQLTSKILFISTFIETLLRRTLSSIERKLLLTSIERVYAKFGISINNLDNDSFNFGFNHNFKMPTLSDLDVELRQKKDGIHLADELEPFINGIFQFSNGQTSIDYNKCNIVAIDMSNVERELTNSVSLLSIEFLSRMIRYMLENNEAKNNLFVVDECWNALVDKEIRDLFVRFIKESKKFNTSFWLASQFSSDILKAFDSSICNFDNIVLFRNPSNQVISLKETIFINDYANALLTFGVGEAVLLKGSLQSFIKIKEDKEVNELIKTLNDIFF